ncbi:MAG: hypothetical protein AAB214_08615, partial [Fibrobacterota bacterium]
MRRRFRSILLLLLPMCLSAQTWTLSGKIVDAEEGNGLKGVQVALAKAGLKATTEKNGSWTIGATGLIGRAPTRFEFSGNALSVREGRLALRLGNADILGRQMPGVASSPAHD